MSFEIQFRTPSDDEITRQECSGIIVLNDFREIFVSSLTYWNLLDYQEHWNKSLERALQREDSCLITSVYDPSMANFIVWWLLYSREDEIVIQNHLLFMDSLSKPFTPQNPYSFIPRYEMENDEGEQISEWKIRVDDIAAFFAQEKSKL